MNNLKIKATRTPTSHSSSSSSSSNARSSSSSSSSSSLCGSPLNNTKTNCDSPLRRELSNFNIATPPPKKRPARSAREKNDDTDEDIDEDSSTVSLSRSSRKSLFSKEKICNGYDPKIEQFFMRSFL